MLRGRWRGEGNGKIHDGHNTRIYRRKGGGTISWHNGDEGSNYRLVSKVRAENQGVDHEKE